MNALAHVETAAYRLTLAAHDDELRAAQRLRYEVFNLELNEGLEASRSTGLDADAFDAVCDHLIVRERETNAVVGTYRLQTGDTALRRLGYYSEQEFELEGFASARSEIVELGRACVDAAHRNQTVLALLWKGIARYAQAQGARYLIGCSSLTSREPADGLAAYAQLAGRHLAAPAWQTRPRPGWRCAPAAGGTRPAAEVKIPRLMSAYLLLGARICGEPAIDREFGTIDFLTWLDLEALAPRVLRKMLG